MVYSWLLPSLDNCGSDWTQSFDFQFQSAQWLAVDLDIAFLQAGDGGSVPDLKWALLVMPSAKVDQVTYQVMAGLKSISNYTISPNFNLAALAINDNRPKLSIR